MMKRLFLLIVLALTLVGCSSKGKTYTVGVDPSWFPLDLMGKQSNVFAFSNELLFEISRLEGINFDRVTRSWDNLSLGLEEKKCDAILSSMYPYVFELSKYAFSDLYLHTGPVLVMRANAKFKGSGGMEEKIIVVNSKENEALFTRLYPQAFIHYYDGIPNALNDLVFGEVDGVAVGYIPAMAFVADLYKGELVIATPPLNEAGLRLITLKEEQPKLIAAFNRGLDKLRASGMYEKLLKKWDLN